MILGFSGSSYRYLFYWLSRCYKFYLHEWVVLSLLTRVCLNVMFKWVRFGLLMNNTSLTIEYQWYRCEYQVSYNISVLNIISPAGMFITWTIPMRL